MVTTNISQSYFRCFKLFIHKILSSYQVYRRKYSRLFIVDMWIYHFWRHTIYCSSVCAKLLRNNIFGFSVVFLAKLSKSRLLELNISRTAWLILMILVLILQDFEWLFQWNKLVSALQFSFNCFVFVTTLVWKTVHSSATTQIKAHLMEKTLQL